MTEESSKRADGMLDRLEARYGLDTKLRARLHPVVVKILESGSTVEHRVELLKLVARAYAHHVRVRDILDELRRTLRHRLNETYGRILGIQPPCI